MENKLEKLFNNCKDSIYINYNPHKNEYSSVEEYFYYLRLADESIDEDIPLEIYNRMVETDTIIEIVAYKDTPIGFFRVYHYDFEKAVDEILKEVR